MGAFTDVDAGAAEKIVWSKYAFRLDNCVFIRNV
jgi:hypothetical protein